MRVYMVRLEETFKVGGSNNPTKRMESFQHHSPFVCSLILDEPGGHRAERKLRNHFKSLGLHIRGEWFRWKRGVLEQAKRILSTMQEDDAMPKTQDSQDGLAGRMQKARVDRGMTQAQLAERLRVKQSMVSMIEAGEEVEDGVKYSDDLAKRIRTFIDSGAGPTQKSPRGPYNKARTTLPSKR